MDEKNAAREKCSEQLRRLLEEVAKVSEELAVRADDRLASVVRSPEPSTPPGESKVAETWPSFLEEIRKSLWLIRSNISRVDNVLSRLEI